MVTGVETPRSDPIRRNGSRGMRRIDCHGFCLRVSGGVCCFPMIGICVLRLTYGVTWLLRAVRCGGSEWDRWCCRDRVLTGMGPTSRLMVAVRSPAAVCGKKLQWWEPAGSRRRLCGWSWNSFFRESAEVFRGPRGRKPLASYRTRDSEGRNPARARRLLCLIALARSDEEAWPKCRSDRPASG